MTIQELKNRIYNDFISSFNNAITPLKKSLFEQISNTLASMFHLVYIFMDRVLNDSFLTTCTQSRVLSYFAPLKNIIRKEATVSSGIVRFTGINTTLVPSGTIIIYNELEYQTIEDGTITTGFADINSESVATGTLNNTLTNIDLFLSVPISGIDNKAVSTAGFNGAIDQETVESVRTRTKQKNGATTQVDNDSFYKSLANEVSNVKASFISDLKNGIGTFGITILTFSNDGVPIQADIDAVETYFNDNEAVPVYVTPDYFLPDITLQAFSILLSADNAENRTITEQAIRDYLYLVQKPNTDFEFSGLADAIQAFGARLVSPVPGDTYSLNNNEVLDVGAISWV